MVAAADAQNHAQKLGIAHGMAVQELGWDEDTEDSLRADIEEVIGCELLDHPAAPCAAEQYAGLGHDFRAAPGAVTRELVRSNVTVHWPRQ